MRIPFAVIVMTALSTAYAATPLHQNKVLDKVGFTQNLDAQVPLDLAFRNESGQTVRIGQFFQGKPVILSLVYFDCPMLCTESLNGLLRAIRSISFDAGKEYNIVTVSFDPHETSSLAAAKNKVYLERYGRSSGAAGWAFLTGDEPSIHKLTEAVGFHYAWDPELQQYAHGTGLVVLTPTGRVSHYLYGVEYSAKELKLALMQASAGKIGSPVDQILLYCYHYDPTTGKYSLEILNVMRLAGAATAAITAVAVLWMLRRERRVAV